VDEDEDEGVELEGFEFGRSWQLFWIWGLWGEIAVGSGRRGTRQEAKCWREEQCRSTWQQEEGRRQEGGRRQTADDH
jgi:hypothetical protein